jgi:hypothetical protein
MHGHEVARDIHYRSDKDFGREQLARPSPALPHRVSAQPASSSSCLGRRDE